MPKIKLIKVINDNSYCSNCDMDLNKFLFDSISPWKEVTDEELQWLTCWEARRYFDEKKIKIVIEDVTEKIDEYIDDIQEFITKQKEKEEKQKRQEEEKAKKRKLLAKQKQIARAKNLLEKTGLKIFDSEE